jgi:hypothetical protein
MPEEALEKPGLNRVLLIWALSATLIVVFLCAVIAFLAVQLSHARSGNRPIVTVGNSVVPPPPRELEPQSGPSPFPTLADTEVPGRYRFFQDGVDLGFIRLLPNHSIINKDGTTYPRYHWEVQPDGIMTVWQRGNVLFNKMESPGVYVSVTKGGAEAMRIEKVPQ